MFTSFMRRYESFSIVYEIPSSSDTLQDKGSVARVYACYSQNVLFIGGINSRDEFGHVLIAAAAGLEFR